MMDGRGRMPSAMTFFAAASLITALVIAVPRIAAAVTGSAGLLVPITYMSVNFAAAGIFAAALSRCATEISDSPEE